MRWWIYAFRDPNDASVRYIGKTARPRQRLREHLRHAKPGTHLGHWLLALRKLGAVPVIEYIDAGIGEGWAAAERAWIAEHRRRGHRLVNAADGGQGATGVERSIATRARLSEAARTSPKAAAQRARLADMKRGKRLSDEHRAKLSAAHIGIPRTQEWRSALAAAATGHTLSVETKAKIGARQAWQGRKHSAETRQRMRLSALRRWRRM